MDEQLQNIADCLNAPHVTDPEALAREVCRLLMPRPDYPRYATALSTAIVADQGAGLQAAWTIFEIARDLDKRDGWCWLTWFKRQQGVDRAFSNLFREDEYGKQRGSYKFFSSTFGRAMCGSFLMFLADRPSLIGGLPEENG